MLDQAEKLAQTNLSGFVWASLPSVGNRSCRLGLDGHYLDACLPGRVRREEPGHELRLDVDRGRLAAALLEVRDDALAALAELVLAEGVPRARALDDAVFGRQVHDVALPRDPLVEEDVELGLPERRRHLVLHDLRARAVADGFLAVLETPDAADVDP